MKTYRVNADFTINVEVQVEADSYEEAERLAIRDIINKECEWLDPIDEPTINWVELEEDEFDPYDDCI